MEKFKISYRIFGNYSIEAENGKDAERRFVEELGKKSKEELMEMLTKNFFEKYYMEGVIELEDDFDDPGRPLVLETYASVDKYYVSTVDKDEWDDHILLFEISKIDLSRIIQKSDLLNFSNVEEFLKEYDSDDGQIVYKSLKKNDVKIPVKKISFDNLTKETLRRTLNKE